MQKSRWSQMVSGVEEGSWDDQEGLFYMRRWKERGLFSPAKWGLRKNTIAFCKNVTRRRTGEGWSRERDKLLSPLKDNVGTETNVYKLSKLSWKLGDRVSKSAETSYNSTWEQA